MGNHKERDPIVLYEELCAARVTLMTLTERSLNNPFVLANLNKLVRQLQADIKTEMGLTTKADHNFYLDGIEELYGAASRFEIQDLCGGTPALLFT